MTLTSISALNHSSPHHWGRSNRISVGCPDWGRYSRCLDIDRLSCFQLQVRNPYVPQNSYLEMFANWLCGKLGSPVDVADIVIHRGSFFFAVLFNELFQTLFPSPYGSHFDASLNQTIGHRSTDPRCSPNEQNVLVWECHLEIGSDQPKWVYSRKRVFDLSWWAVIRARQSSRALTPHVYMHLLRIRTGYSLASFYFLVLISKYYTLYYSYYKRSIPNLLLFIS